MIELIYDYVIDVSQNNYTLMRDRHKQDKKGHPLYETLGYYCNLETAIMAAKEHCVKERICDNAVTLMVAVEIIKQVNDEFRNLLKGVLNND